MSKLVIEAAVEAKKAKADLEGLGKAAADGFENAGRRAEDMGRAAEKAAAAMQKSAKASRDSADSLQVSSRAMMRFGISMAGMMAGIAGKWAANNLDEKSTARTVLEYGGNALTNAGAMAMAGSAFGPAGTAIGAGAGAIKGVAETYLDREGAEKAEEKAKRKQNQTNREFIENLIESEKRIAAFRESLEEMSDKEKDLSLRQYEVAQAIAKREEREKELNAAMKAESHELDGDDANFKRLAKERTANHSELETLRSLQKALSKEDNKASGPGLPGAMDSLSRVGGYFGEVSSGFLRLEKTSEAQLKCLEKIARKEGGKF